ncbi:MAG: Hsp20/alpha crystallin family protein [Candidatus Verstraetearchaeota archaeon]|jgi:HSP20 family protein|nr:Hsp20/alpha crystallin family protein [Candidatus Verstraetearchaeota archaeon]
MSEDEFFSRWFRRRWRIFDELFRDLEDMMREMEEEFSRMARRGLIREEEFPGGKIREYGPFIYGYSITIGPDGKPIIREFGNVKPGIRPSIKEEREPLIDVMTTENEVKVYAEIPGVEKEKIKLTGTPRKLIISAEGDMRKYYKEIELPVEVDIEKAKSSYRNGVLEVILPRKEKEEGRPIKIE